jgi:hypothetical protein
MCGQNDQIYDPNCLKLDTVHQIPTSLETVLLLPDPEMSDRTTGYILYHGYPRNTGDVADISKL